MELAKKKNLAKPCVRPSGVRCAVGAHIFPRVSVEVVLVLDADELVVAGLVARAVAVVKERIRLRPATRPDVAYKRKCFVLLAS